MLMKALSRRIATAVLVALSMLLVFGAAVALAAEDAPQGALALSADQTWTALLGGLAPLFMYVVNHYAPWVDEKAKAIAQVVFAALVGVVWQLHSGGDLDLGSAATWQYILTAVVSALVAHGMLYTKSGINVALKAGTNKQDH